MQFAQDDVTEPNWEPLAEPSPKHRSEDSSEQHSKGAKKIKRRSGPRAGKACDHCAVKKTRCSPQGNCDQCHDDNVECKYSSDQKEGTRCVPLKDYKKVDAARHEERKCQEALKKKVEQMHTRYQEFVKRYCSSHLGEFENLVAQVTSDLTTSAEGAGDFGLTFTSCGKRPFESVLSGRPMKTRFLKHSSSHTSVPVNSEISEGTTTGTSTDATDISSVEVDSPHESNKNVRV